MTETGANDGFDVIVVGAGLSGLVCARTLDRLGASVAVLEARRRVGGRTLSLPLGSGVADLGGQWVGPTQRRVLSLAEELGVALFPQYRTGRSLLASGPGAGASPHRFRLFSSLELVYRMRQLERMCAQVPIDAPDLAKRAAEWDAMSFGDWLERRVRTRDARALLGLIAELKLATEPGEASLLGFLDFVRASGGLISRELFEETGAQEMRLEGGAQVLCQRLAAGLGDRVQLNAAVEAVEQDSARGVRVRAADQWWKARRIILALPPSLAERISFRPALPSARRKLQRRARMGPIIKCALGYETAFWRDAGYSGEAYNLAGDVRAITDDCSDDQRQAALAVFVVGARAHALSALPAAERRERVVECVAGLFGNLARAVVDYREMDWAAAEWSRGCVTYFGTGVLSDCHSALRAPLGRIHFAGSETAREWHGHLEGAVESGQRAAAEVWRQIPTPRRTIEAPPDGESAAARP